MNMIKFMDAVISVVYSLYIVGCCSFNPVTYCTYTPVASEGSGKSARKKKDWWKSGFRFLSMSYRHRYKQVYMFLEMDSFKSCW